ncbi:hypothetical protein BB561_000131 [Smittium simulii]|uniref:Uncharacterized protein n=1 Tax=Smittium simulii TaxID=133385 RepID=A0A2T9Z092_9FUNG|nr:hypothetical protein BB561_000131 [Smittium simulii]
MFQNIFKLPTAEEYVSEKSLDNLRLYKYSAVDKSYLTKYALSHYWNWAVTLFPLWMAPNLITLLGLGFQVVSIFLILIYDPELTGPAPSWVYLYYGIGMWLYSTFDNVDGKQARRTNSSSPLGELFDHGCDALNCMFGAIVQSAAFGLGISNATLMFCFMKYHTGTLYLGYINGPTEVLVSACLASFASSIYGPQIWHMKANDFIPFSRLFFSDKSSIIDVIIVITFIGGIFFAVFARILVAAF